jgi:hypothetical protein
VVVAEVAEDAVAGAVVDAARRLRLLARPPRQGVAAEVEAG